jgi:TonB family protein
LHLPSRRFTRSIAFLLFVVATFAQPLGVHAQARAPLPYQQPECGIGVSNVVPIGANAPSRTEGAQFFVYLWSPQAAHTISGTLWVNASGVPYHVPFANVRVSPGFEKPIAIRLPAQAALESVSVDSISGTSTGSCGITNAWTPAMPSPAAADLTVLETQKPDAFVAAQPIANAAAACTVPDVAGFVVRPELPQVPKAAIEKHIDGDVAVLIVLRTDSTVRSVSILQRSDGMFGEEALRVARETLFRAEFRSCQPIVGRFTFNVHFSRE